MTNQRGEVVNDLPLWDRHNRSCEEPVDPRPIQVFESAVKAHDAPGVVDTFCEGPDVLPGLTGKIQDSESVPIR